MRSLFDARSIRARIALSTLLIVLPVAGTVGWLLATDVRQAREAAHAKVKILATASADDVQRFLRQSAAVLGQLAARPRVALMDPSRCDPLVREYAEVNPEFAALAVRSARGDVVCANAADPLSALSADTLPWFETALHGTGLHAGDAMALPRDARWVSVLSHPVRNDAGLPVGLLTLPVDLWRLSDQFLTSVPSNAVVTVLDRQRTVLLRSSDARTFVGHRRPASDADPFAGQREGFDQAVGRDGVLRVLAFVTLPGSEWQVVAGLPASEVFADYNDHLMRTAAIAVAVALIGLALAWRLGASIATPIAGLAATARHVAAGDLKARAELGGPTELITVAEQFNRMLDARNAAEAALRESEQRYRTLVDWSPEALSVHRDGKVLFVNPAAVELLGAESADELIGRESLEVIPPDSRPAVLEVVESAIGHGNSIVRREQRFTRRDGTHIDVEVHGTRIVFNGHPALIASMRDITKRKQFEAELRESEARQRRLLTLLPEAVFVDTGDRVTFVNEAALELFGHPAEAVMGRSPLTLVHPDSVELARSRIAALHQGATVAPLVEMKIVRADGAVRVVEAMGTLIQEQGEKSVLVVMRDITDLKQAQSALAQSHADLQRLFTAEDRVQEDERKRIARELHDDLQQTLAAIRMNLKAAGERLSADPQGAVALLTEVDALAGAAIASTRRIVNDLRPPIIEDLGLAAALEMLAAQFQQHSGIDCRVELHDDGGAAVEAPAVATSLYRVAQESLNNVLKHAKAGQVTIRLARTSDDRVSLGIHDDGVGFDAMARHKPRSFGLLGMSERIRALGGVLHIQSRLGRGTTIEVLMPADHPGPRTAGAQRAPGPGAPAGMAARSEA